MLTAKFENRKRSLLFYISVFCFCFSACSIPNLEPPECGEARVAARQFYSLLFANEEDSSPTKHVRGRERFLTPELISGIGESSDSIAMTAMSEFPDTFRIGECEAVSANRVVLEIQLLSRSDSMTHQRPVRIETVQTANQWLIDKVLIDY